MKPLLVFGALKECIHFFETPGINLFRQMRYTMKPFPLKVYGFVVLIRLSSEFSAENLSFVAYCESPLFGVLEKTGYEGMETYFKVLSRQWS
jgi:hypothetical protein